MTDLIVVISEVPSQVRDGEHIRLLLTVKGYVTVRVTRTGRLTEPYLARDRQQAYMEYHLAGNTPGGVQLCNFNGDAFLVPIVVHDLAAVAS